MKFGDGFVQCAPEGQIPSPTQVRGTRGRRRALPHAAPLSCGNCPRFPSKSFTHLTAIPEPSLGLAAAGSPGASRPYPAGISDRLRLPAAATPCFTSTLPRLRGSLLHLVPCSGIFGRLLPPPPPAQGGTDTHGFGGGLFFSLGSHRYSFL